MCEWGLHVHLPKYKTIVLEPFQILCEGESGCANHVSFGQTFFDITDMASTPLLIYFGITK